MSAPSDVLAQATSSGSFPPESPAPAAAPAPAALAPAAAAPAPAAPVPPPPAPPPPAAPTVAEPPPPPARPTDNRPIREQRRFFIGGELGWNGLAGLGANFSYHPIPHFAMEAGLGLSLAGLRIGTRARFNFLTSEWTPFVASGITYSGGSGGESTTVKSGSEEAQIEVLPSPYVQFAAGVNYTGTGGFVFMATTGYALLLEKDNTRYVSGSQKAYEDVSKLLDGGVIVSVAFGYAF